MHVIPMPQLELFDIEGFIQAAGPWALVLVCAIVFVETGLLVGFLLPGDTLLVITGILTYTGVIPQPIWVVCGAIWICAVAGDQLGYAIGRKLGPAVFQRNRGIFSYRTVERTNHFFVKYGAWAVIIARFIGIVRTFMPVAAGVGKMPYGKFLRYDILGGFLWGGCLTLLGWVIAHIPGVAEIVTEYIDLVLIGVVVIAIGAIAIHSIQQRREIRAEERAGLATRDVEILDLTHDTHGAPTTAPTATE